MPTTTTTFAPSLGDPAVVEVLEGSRVRDPLSMRVIDEPKTVVWSVFFQRRLNDGSISVAPYTEAPAETAEILEEL